MSLSILLVVGDEEERLGLRRALADEGWKVLPSGTGRHARQVSEELEFDVAVVDTRLPDERGFQVISAVEGPGVTTVALLRDEDTMDRIVGIELGADHYMRYPPNPRELVARIRARLRRRPERIRLSAVCAAATDSQPQASPAGTEERPKERKTSCATSSACRSGTALPRS